MEEQYGFVDPSKIQFLENEQPSTLGKIARSGAQLATEAVKAPFYLAELPAKAVGYVTGRKPNQPFISEQIQSAKEKYLGEYKPENIVEKGLHYTAGNWPALFLGGGPTLGKLGADIAGSTAMAASEEVSDNPLVAIGADILGRKGFRSAGNFLKGVPKEPGKIRSYISDLYKKENELGSKIPAKDASRKISHKLDKINEELRKEYVNPGKFDEAARNRVLKNLETAEQSLYKPNITVADLAQEEKNLNKAWSFKNSTENEYYKRIKNAFSEELKSEASRHSDWGKNYLSAKELYQIDKWNTGLDRWVKKATGNDTLGKIVTNPDAQAAIALLSGVAFKGPSGAIYAGLPYVGKKAVKAGEATVRATKFLEKLSQNPEGRKVLMDIVADSAKNNFSALNKSMYKFNSLANELSDDSDIQYDYVDPSKIKFE